MERSFREEVRSLRLGEGEVFHGEGILAVTKALLQSGVSYVSGYPGAPVSHLVDVLTDASDILDELGVHFEPAGQRGRRRRHAAARRSTIRSAARRPGSRWSAPTSPPTRCRTSSSAGVMGGALIVVGEDYGEGASIIQERAHAFAMKSQMWLLDPRPEPADHRRHGRAGLRAVGGKLHAGDAGAAHPRLPRARQLRVQGQPRAATVAQASSSMRRSSTMRGSACRRRPTPRRSTRSTCAGRPRSDTSRSIG